ncbi:MAG: hypothetical protein V1698_01790 [bacterium]
MNISSKSSYPSCALSNFASHSFLFDNIICASMEGILQSFKFQDPTVQIEICGCEGREAKKRGSEIDWKSTQTLWWKGMAIDRHSEEYQALLDRVYNALYQQSEDFREALKASGDDELTHSVGASDPQETILTEREFCSRLMKLRRDGVL